MDVRGIPNQGSVFQRMNDGISPFEDGLGTEGSQLGVRGMNAGFQSLEVGVCGGLRTAASVLEALPLRTDAMSRVKTLHSVLDCLESSGTLQETQSCGVLQAEQEFIQSHGRLVNPRGRRTQSRCGELESTLGVLHAACEASVQVKTVAVEALDHVREERDRHLRCRCGRGSPLICDEIREEKVHFVADGGDDRRVRSMYGPHELLVVESPEIFERTASSAEQNHVDVLDGVEPFDRAHELRRGVRTLNGGRMDQDRDWEAVMQDSQHVADSGARRGGDDPDPSREPGEWFPMGGVEEAFRFQCSFHPLEGGEKSAVSRGTDLVDDDLMTSMSFVDGDSSMTLDPHSVLQSHRASKRVRTKHHAGQFCIPLGQCEIDVPGTGLAEIDDLPFHPGLTILGLQQLLDATRETRHRENGRGGWSGLHGSSPGTGSSLPHSFDGENPGKRSLVRWNTRVDVVVSAHEHIR